MGNSAILCVDDEAIILLSMKHELKSHFRDRFRFETATGAEEALRLLKSLEADGTKVMLVITDWLMPGMKGDEFLLEIHRRYPDLPSIMVTGHADPSSIERVLKETNTRTILQKPWRNEELIAAVNACVQIRN